MVLFDKTQRENIVFIKTTKNKRDFTCTKYSKIKMRLLRIYDLMFF